MREREIEPEGMGALIRETLAPSCTALLCFSCSVSACMFARSVREPCDACAAGHAAKDPNLGSMVVGLSPSAEEKD